MGPKRATQRSDHDLFCIKLVSPIDQLQGRVKMAGLIDWQVFADKWARSQNRRPDGTR